MAKMSFKFEPVAWLTTAAVVGGALLEADREYHVLPAGAGHWIGFVVVAAGLIGIGLKARDKSTALADPRAANGRPLVPHPPAQIPPGTPPVALDADGDSGR